MSTETVEIKEEVKQPCFTAKINGKLLKEMMTYIAYFVEEATFNVVGNEPPTEPDTEYNPSVPGWLKVCDLDSSDVAMIDFAAPLFSFTAPGGFVVNIKDLNKSIVGRLLQGEVELSLEEHALIIQNAREKARLPLLQATRKESPIPKLRFNGHITISRQALYEAIFNITKISDQARLKLTDEGLTIETASELGQYETSFLKGDPEVYDIVSYAEPLNENALYGTLYLKDMLSFKPAPTVKLQFTTDQPIMLNYTVPPVTITSYLAPRLG